jgi:hypothetical protein
MDEIVLQSMVKWPNVPHCHGWLALDARGVFRMRDEAAQINNLAGDPIRHAALLAFIHRNYACDARCAWYFQNGPQRVYVDLAATPYIARTDPAAGFVLHDGQPMTAIEQVFLTEEGQLVLQDAEHSAMLDDRDVVHCLPHLHSQGQAVEDAQLLAWLEAPDAELRFMFGGKAIPVQAIRRTDLAAQLGFVALPR